MNYIYKLTNKINGKSYIGFTTQDPKERWYEHWINSRCASIKETALYSAIKKYGWENFTKRIVCKHHNFNYCLNTLETKYIKKFKSHTSQHGYNMTWGGNMMFDSSNPMKGRKHTLETKQKISQATKGRIPWNKGKKWNKDFILNGLNRTKNWIIIYPNGTKESIQNLNAFCQKHNLTQPSMIKVANHQFSNHRGYSCERVG